MAFFLIGRGSDDELRLLSPKPLASRQDAMAELSRLSADPSFDQWDAEVSVMDLDSGVPILLVRSGAEAVAVPETIVADAGGAGAWEADIPAETESEASVHATEAPDESPAEVPAPAEETPEPAAWEPPALAVVEPVNDAAIADAIAEEAAATPVGLPAGSARVAETDRNEELRAAVLRMGQHVTPEVMVAPESAAFDEPEIEPRAEAEPAAPEATEESAPPSLPAGEQASNPLWPWDTSAESAEPESAAAAPEVASVYGTPPERSDELPGPDVEAGPRRVVMMGSYRRETDSSVEPAASAPGTNSPMGIGGGEQPSGATETSENESDFILDLDSVEPALIDDDAAAVVDQPVATHMEGEPAVDEVAQPPEAAEASSLTGHSIEDVAASPLEGYTCADCVHVATCPNRDVRLPKDCGSFQWR